MLGLFDVQIWCGCLGGCCTRLVIAWFDVWFRSLGVTPLYGFFVGCFGVSAFCLWFFVLI